MLVIAFSYSISPTRLTPLCSFTTKSVTTTIQPWLSYWLLQQTEPEAEMPLPQSTQFMFPTTTTTTRSKNRIINTSIHRALLQHSVSKCNPPALTLDYSYLPFQRVPCCASSSLSEQSAISVRCAEEQNSAYTYRGLRSLWTSLTPHFTRRVTKTFFGIVFKFWFQRC